MVYLFVGQDAPAKEEQLKKIKERFLSRDLEQFNLDVLYAKELRLKLIQEKFLSLPVKAQRRLLVIKDAQALDERCRDFILRYAREPAKEIVLVLDWGKYEPREAFLQELLKHCKLVRFKENFSPDVFALNREIQKGNMPSALSILSALFGKGESPERILGGLRYALEKESEGHDAARKKLGLLLGCDVDIKTGRLAASLALEKLIIALCGLVKPAH